MDGEAGWWTTSGNIGLPPLARVMGVGSNNNNSLEKCRGKWTRSSGCEKSIIDYIMMGEEEENGVESIIIDENIEKFSYRMRRSDGITQ